jgi:hypothetical protein
MRTGSGCCKQVSVPTIDTFGCARFHPFGNGKPQKRAGPATRERRKPWRRQAPPFPESVIHRELAFQAQIPRQSRQRVLANQLRRGVLNSPAIHLIGRGVSLRSRAALASLPGSLRRRVANSDSCQPWRASSSAMIRLTLCSGVSVEFPGVALAKLTLHQLQQPSPVQACTSAAGRLPLYAKGLMEPLSGLMAVPRRSPSVGPPPFAPAFQRWAE